MNYRAIHMRLYERGLTRIHKASFVKYGKASLTPKEHVLALRLRLKYERDHGARVILENELNEALLGTRLNPLQKIHRTMRTKRAYVWRGQPRSLRLNHNPFWGRTHTAENRERFSEVKRGELNHRYGVSVSEEAKRMISNELRGVPKTEEHKRNMSLNWHKREKVQCHACGGYFNKTMWVRYHGNNCRRAIAADWHK